MNRHTWVARRHGAFAVGVALLVVSAPCPCRRQVTASAVFPNRAPSPGTVTFIEVGVAIARDAARILNRRSSDSLVLRSACPSHTSHRR